MDVSARKNLISSAPSTGPDGQALGSRGMEDYSCPTRGRHQP